MKPLKQFLNWLFADFFYYLYELAEQKFTLADGPRLVKQFLPNSVMIGMPSVLRITIINSVGTGDLTNVQVRDNYPPFLINTATPNRIIPIVPVLATLVAGFAFGSKFFWDIPLIAEGDTVVSEINVTSNTAGVYANGDANLTVFTDQENLQLGRNVILTVTAPPVKKSRKKLGLPHCFNPSIFPDEILPRVFDYKANGRITRLYQIGDTACYTPYPPRQNQF